VRGKKTGGRQLGTVNRLTHTCREAIEFAGDALGGAERLAEWAAASPDNEAAFWRHIYPRLLPSSLHMLELQQQRDASKRPRSKEEILQWLEEERGPEARRLFEAFVAQLSQLRLEQQRPSAIPLSLNKAS
jgi:hypothetical protein